MHRVRLDVAAAGNDINLDDNQIVDVLQIIADTLLAVLFRVELPDDEVSGGTIANLGRHMARQDKLAIRPLYVDLLATISPAALGILSYPLAMILTRLFLMYKSCLRA